MKREIDKTKEGPFIVKSDGKTSEPLGWEEMLGLIAALTIPENKPCVHWMHEEIRDVPFDDVKEKQKCLVAIGKHYPTQILKDKRSIKVLCVENKDSYLPLFHPNTIYYNGHIINSEKENPECDSWENWLNNLVDTLDVSDLITTYSYYD